MGFKVPQYWVGLIHSLVEFFSCMPSIAYGARKVRYFKKFSDIYSEKLPENFAR
jgi:hypothetical protein